MCYCHPVVNTKGFLIITLMNDFHMKHATCSSTCQRVHDFFELYAGSYSFIIPVLTSTLVLGMITV